MSTNAIRKTERALAYVLVVLAIVAFVLSSTNAFPTTKVIAASQGLDSAAPYTRYARPVRSSCDASIVFESLDVSKGGNTYSEWVFYAGTDQCSYESAIKLHVVARATASPAPDNTSTKPSTSTPVVTSTPVITNTPVVTPTAVVTTTPSPTDTPMPTKTEKAHCNKGEGNGGEGCDPGNNPDKGNDDEDGG